MLRFSYPSIFLSILVLTGLVGCGQDRESSAAKQKEGGQVRAGTGGEVVVWSAGEAWSVAETPELSIGVLDGRTEYQFVQVVGGARLSGGEIVVVDQGAKSVRLYGADGAFIRTLGGPGSGPGEFESPVQVTVIAGDSVGVWDDRLFRITWFDSAGQMARVQSVDLGTISKAVDPPLYPGPVVPLGSGELLVRLIEKNLTKGGRVSPSEGVRSRSGALIVSEDLSRVDTLGFFGDAEEIALDAPWGPQSAPAPFGRTTVVAHSGNPATVCIGDQTGPVIECTHPGGERITLSVPGEAPRPYEHEMETWRSATAQWFGEKVSRSDIRRMLDQVVIPEERPPYSSIRFDAQGHLWVELGPEKESVDSPRIYQILRPDGAFLGTVLLPPVQVLEIGVDYVLGLYRDELEVEYVRVFQLSRGHRALESAEGPA